MRILDLFCKAGGAAMGLHQAFPSAEIYGVDIENQPRYPFRFWCADVWEWAVFDWRDFDFIWASPPCQAYTTMRVKKSHRERPDYIPALRNKLLSTGRPFTIENVPGAPLIDAVTLCGQFFGLGVRRHRKFESLFRVTQPDCRPHHKPHPVAVYGDHPETNHRSPGAGGKIYRATSLKAAQDAMGIDWMNWRELTQAVPPAYSRYIGEQFMKLGSLPDGL